MSKEIADNIVTGEQARDMANESAHSATVVELPDLPHWLVPVQALGTFLESQRTESASILPFAVAVDSVRIESLQSQAFHRPRRQSSNL